MRRFLTRLSSPGWTRRIAPTWSRRLPVGPVRRVVTAISKPHVLKGAIPRLVATATFAATAALECAVQKDFLKVDAAERVLDIPYDSDQALPNDPENQHFEFPQSTLDVGGYARRLDEVVSTPGAFAIIHQPLAMSDLDGIRKRLHGRKFVFPMYWGTDRDRLDRLLVQRAGLEGLDLSYHCNCGCRDGVIPDAAMSSHKRQNAVLAVLEFLFAKRHVMLQGYHEAPNEAPVIFIANVDKRVGPVDLENASIEELRSDAARFLEWALRMSVQYKVTVIMLGEFQGRAERHIKQRVRNSENHLRVIDPNRWERKTMCEVYMKGWTGR